MKRRNLLIAAGGMALVAGSARASGEDELVEFLFVQTAPGVRLSGGTLTIAGKVIGTQALVVREDPLRR